MSEKREVRREGQKQYAVMSAETGPVGVSERYMILDVLRGIALLGICLANFPEFSLYTFQKEDVTEAMPTAGVDRIIKYLQYIFIDGKFYSLFSLLFGIGFAVIMSNLSKKGVTGYWIFYRRMVILMVIGFLHLMFLWSGDILLLYALTGMLLPLFGNTSGRKLIVFSAVLIFFPVVLDTLKVICRFDPAVPVIKATQYFNLKSGITDDNFGTWLRDGESYTDMLKFTLSGAFIRCREFIDGHRIFKVLGLFLLGLYIGRNRIYAGLDDYKALLKKLRLYGFLVGLPVSCFYAWSALNQNPLGLIGRSAAYALSVVPMSLAYAASICLWYMKNKELPFFRLAAAPGRMALTNYIGQSAFGMMIFYGIGFGLGATMGLVYVELVALGVFLLQALCSYAWLKRFRFGPLEWLWRMLTYRKRLKLMR
ncbi:MAG: DUF418 domain-containing protein [Tannerella sp.]|jgi:uncharacterized protein|nr:DUF418 domain-containing protein [Tannerella sp.]